MIRSILSLGHKNSTLALKPISVIFFLCCSHTYGHTYISKHMSLLLISSTALSIGFPLSCLALAEKENSSLFMANH